MLVIIAYCLVRESPPPSQISNLFSSHTSTCSPDTVAEGILKLIADESLVGTTMTVTLKRGIDYWMFPDDGNRRKPTSKL